MAWLALGRSWPLGRDCEFYDRRGAARLEDCFTSTNHANGDAVSTLHIHAFDDFQQVLADQNGERGKS